MRSASADSHSAGNPEGEARRFSFAGCCSTNKRLGKLALRSCSMTGGDVQKGIAGRCGRKDGNGTLNRPLSCAGPLGIRKDSARLFRPKYFITNKVGGSTHSPGAVRSQFIINIARVEAQTARLGPDKLFLVPCVTEPAGIFAERPARWAENAAIECAVDCANVSERGRCYREERGRRQQTRAGNFRHGAGADKICGRRYVSYGEHPCPARTVRFANLLTRQG